LSPGGRTPCACAPPASADAPEDWALTEHPATEAPEIIISGQTASIRNGNLIAKIGAGGYLVFENQKANGCSPSNGTPATRAFPPSVPWR
jgi:hypothetical protein